MRFHENEISACQDALVVAAIATPRREISHCSHADTLADVLPRMGSFDILPVIAGDGHFIGFLQRDDAQRFSPEAAVERIMTPLTERGVIGARTPIIEYILESGGNFTRLVVERGGVSGLVTESDLQRLPTRSALFALFCDLEVSLHGAIKAATPDWALHLSNARRESVAEKKSKALAARVELDDLFYTELADKLDVLWKSKLAPDLAPSRAQFDKRKKQVVDLRNDIAHASPIYAGRSVGLELHATISFMLDCLTAARKITRDDEVGRARDTLAAVPNGAAVQGDGPPESAHV